MKIIATEPHAATRHHAEPHGTTQSHTAPHGATRSHTEPHGATRSYTEPTRSHTEPHGATRNRTEPRGTTHGHGITERHGKTNHANKKRPVIPAKAGIQPVCLPLACRNVQILKTGSSCCTGYCSLLDPRLRGDDRNYIAPARRSYDISRLILVVLCFFSVLTRFHGHLL